MSVSGTPRVAVVIACFNDGDELREAATSALRDAVPRELVIVDDGSTNELTRRILGELERDGVRVVRQVNKGTSLALMAGVAATSAPFVYRLDSDDIVEAGALEDLADALEAHPEAAAAWGDLTTFGLTNFRVPSNPVLDPWHMTFTNSLPSCSMFRRTTLLDAGGWQFRGGIEDWDLWMSLAERGNTGVYVPRVVYRWRREEQTLFADAISRYGTDFEELRRDRHPRLFTERRRNRRHSPAPLALKLLLPVVDGLPVLSRLHKAWIAQLLTNLFWNGGLGVTAAIVRQGIAIRLRRHG
jgi:glycosyltransferase involved in cell wall biosynthesis